MPLCAAKHSKIIAVALMISSAVSGCGKPPGRPTGTVSGTVKIAEGPLPAGIVLFEDSTRGIGASAKIADGKFVFSDPVPTGTYQVAIQPPPAGNPMSPMPEKTATPAVSIPKKYLKPEASGLQQIVKVGANTADFKLESQ